MSDDRFFGVLTMLGIAVLVLGFVIGWCANPDDDHD